MNITQLRASDHILLDVVAGSHMYGLNIETSDVDHRGIFNLPIADYLRFNAPKQVACDMNDEVYYEIRRFLELAASANPNILEILFAPERSVVYKHPSIDIILKHRDKFLTKACANSLGGYAVQQIRKARGQNKLVTKPIVTRKTVLDFCYVYTGQENSYSLINYLERYKLKQSDIGLTKVNNFANCYCGYFNWGGVANNDYNGFKPKGMMDDSNRSNELRLTSIPSDVELESILISYNKDGYTAHCKDFKEYTHWVKNRNPERYETNLETLKAHTKFYDKKNMMHCMRLLNMGIELAKTGKLNVERPDREYLLSIRMGEMPYEKIMADAEAKIIEMEEAFKVSTLPDSVDTQLLEDILLEYKLGES